MSVSQADIDALLAGASDLADEAGGDAPASAAPSQATPSPAATNMIALSPSRSVSPTERELDRILKVSVPVIVKLAEQDMPVSRVLGIAVGSIIEFDRAFDAELDLLVGNQPIGIGQAVKVGENFGLRITEMGDIDERIKALGQTE